MQENLKKDSLVNLYTSTIISGNYDCFRFDLTKFPQTYMASNKSLTLYMIGRTGKYEGSLGCSWATSIEGLSSYCQSSSMLRPIFDLRPIFVIEINDSQVLFEGRTSEHECKRLINRRPYSDWQTTA